MLNVHFTSDKLAGGFNIDNKHYTERKYKVKFGRKTIKLLCSFYSTGFNKELFSFN